MAKRLWDKGGASIDDEITAFCAADDVLLDRLLLGADIEATAAHVRGLGRIGVLTPDDVTALCAALDTFAADYEAGRFILDARFEDGHSAIEAQLIEAVGDLGKRVHTGRSRNDQVLVALRLVQKRLLTELAETVLACAEQSLARASATIDVAMPGYTHLQRAMPMSVAGFFAGHAEAFVDAAATALAMRDLIDACPLGTGSGFGVSLPLDRTGVARDLGFARVVVNPQAAQAQRGRTELLLLAAFEQACVDVRRLAWDLSLFVTAEFGFVRIPDAFTTGSSLMPNKRNPDVIELLRTLPAVVEGARAETAALLSLPSGYQRDLQATKGPFLRASTRALAGLRLVPRLLAGVEFDAAALRAAISPDMYSTDRALELVVAGVPFRDAYARAAADIPALAARAPQQSLHARVSLGGAHNLGLDLIAARAAQLRAAVSAA